MVYGRGLHLTTSMHCSLASYLEICSDISGLVKGRKFFISEDIYSFYRSQWSPGIRNETSSPIRMLRSRVQIPLEAWMPGRAFIQVVLPAVYKQTKNKRTPWPESTSELYRPSDRRLSEKLVPPFANRGCRVVSATDT
jgi:hypothetical protein